MRYAIVVYDGYNENDALGPYEVLSQLRAIVSDVEVGLVAPDGAESVNGAHGLSVGPVTGDLHSADVVVIPGGGWFNAQGSDSEHTRAGVLREVEKGALPAKLADAYGRGATVASVCTGTWLLLAAGLLDGRRVTCHPIAYDALEQRGVQIERRRVVDDGRILTSGGVTAGIDLALWLAERSYGTRVAEAVARALDYRWSKDVYLTSAAARNR
jgi:transcriptional regulator GlxA family with amidase domain